jgi:membrane-associated phospholipid phosphatase
MKYSASRVQFFVFAPVLALAFSCCAQSQEPSSGLIDAPQPQTDSRDAITIRNMPRDLLRDQARIWISPVRIRPHDLEWLSPLALATGAAIATDHRAMTQIVSDDSGFNQANIDTSNILIGGFIVTPIALYGLGRFQQDRHAREAGILGAETLVDGVAVEQGMKIIFWRERPGLDDSRGRFFQSSVGIDSSFPSSHSLLAWSEASLIAGEYPSRWVQFAAYSAATGVSLTRIMGQQHFPSDVLVGSAAGWFVGRYVVHRHRRLRSAPSRTPRPTVSARLTPAADSAP